MGKIIGIDLGKSNSAASVMIGGKPTIIQAAEGTSVGGKAFPSYVAFTKDGQLLVGEPARRQMVTNPEGTVIAAKRKMGTDFKFKVYGKEYTPQQISSFILQKIKRDSEAYVGETVDKAVITVPAYFNDSQRQATKDAGMIAGLEVVRIINEPTAASLAYGLQQKTQGTIAVYDLGGGTFDISILKLKDGIFEVLATNGDTHLGGDDIDRRVADLFVKEIRSAFDIDLMAYPEHMQAARLEAERAKIRLSDSQKAEIFIELPDEKGGFTRELTRSQLEELAAEIVERTLSPCRLALKDAGVTPERIDE